MKRNSNLLTALCIAGGIAGLLAPGCKRSPPQIKINQDASAKYVATAIINTKTDIMEPRNKLFIYDLDGDRIADEALITYGWTPVSPVVGRTPTNRWKHLVAEGLPYEKQRMHTDNTRTMTAEERETLSGVLGFGAKAYSDNTELRGSISTPWGHVPYQKSKAQKDRD